MTADDTRPHARRACTISTGCSRSSCITARWAPAIAYVSGLVLGLATLAVFGFIDILRANLLWTDFSGFWAGPRALLDGADPYDASTWRQTVDGLGTQRPTEDVYGYPPWALVVLLPLGALSLGLATALWTVGGVFLAALGTWALLRRAAPDDALLSFLTGYVLLGSTPAIISFYSGQWTFLLVGAMAWSVASLVSGRSRAAGLWALASIVKPHLFVFLVLGLARAALARGHARALATAAIIGIALVVLPSLVRPEWLAAWSARVPGQRSATGGATLPNALGDVLGPAGVWLGVALLLAAIALAWSFGPRGDASLAVWATLSAAASVYGWAYDHLLLVVPLVLAAGLARRRSRAWSRGVALGGAALLVIGELALYQVAVARGDQSLNALVPATMLLVVASALWPLRRSNV